VDSDIRVLVPSCVKIWIMSDTYFLVNAAITGLIPQFLHDGLFLALIVGLMVRFFKHSVS